MDLYFTMFSAHNVRVLRFQWPIIPPRLTPNYQAAFAILEGLRALRESTGNIPSGRRSNVLAVNS